MRDAISLLDQMLSYGTEAVTLAQVQQVLGAVSSHTVGDLVDALASGNVAEGLKLVQQLALDGASLTEFCRPGRGASARRDGGADDGRTRLAHRLTGARP